MEEVDTTEDSRQMLVFTHSLNLSVAEEAISNSFPKISSTPKILPAQNPPPLSFFQSKVTPPSYSSHPGNCRPSPQLLPEQSSIRAPPLHSSAAKAPDDVPSGRKLARSSSEAGKKGPAEPPTCNYSHPHPRRQNTSIDSAPGELSLQDLPHRCVPLQNPPARTKADPNPHCAADHATRDRHTTPFTMPDSSTQTLPPPAAPSRALARPVSEALLNEKVSLAP